jgi:protein TonB
MTASLLIHGSFIALIALLNAASNPERRPVSIDLGLLGPTARPGPSAPAPAGPKPRKAVQPESVSQDAAPSPEEKQPETDPTIASGSDASASGSDSVPAGNGNGAVDQNGLRQTYVNEYFAYIRDRILKNLYFPPAARTMGWSGKVAVSFVICRDGRVENVKIVESTGFEVLDRNVVNAIKRASPFPRPPVESQLILPILYKLL